MRLDVARIRIRTRRRAFINDALFVKVNNSTLSITLGEESYESFECVNRRMEYDDVLQPYNITLIQVPTGRRSKKKTLKLRKSLNLLKATS